jgi:hypothetical protein
MADIKNHLKRKIIQVCWKECMFKPPKCRIPILMSHGPQAWITLSERRSIRFQRNYNNFSVPMIPYDQNSNPQKKKTWEEITTKIQSYQVELLSSFQGRIFNEQNCQNEMSHDN